MAGHAPTCLYSGGDGLGLEQRQRRNSLLEPEPAVGRDTLVAARISCIDNYGCAASRADERDAGACGQAWVPATRGLREMRPRHGGAAPRWRRLAVGCSVGRSAARSALLVLGALLIAMQVAGQSPELLENNGGHFRFGNIRWEKVEGNLVQFTLETAWRRDYSSAYWHGSGDDGLTVVGDVIHLNGKQWPVFNYGDDSLTAGEYLKLQVMAYSRHENWVYGHSVITHTYATPNNKGKPWVVSFTGCCKLSEINNQPQMDAPWLIQASIDLLQLTKSPRITAMPVFSIPDPPILQTPAPPLLQITPRVPVSFYVPGFHPDGSDRTVVSLASPLTALSGTLPDPREAAANNPRIVPECDAQGKVTLNFHGIMESEFADAGMFYFLKLNATSMATGLFVQADFLIRVHKRPDQFMPKIAFGHTDLKNLAGPPTINGTIIGQVTPHADGYEQGTPAAKFWPNGSYEGYLGFVVNYTIVAQDPNHMQRLGFTAMGLPEYARVTTVKGTNPVEIKTYWIPCAGQVGRHVSCYEAVDNAGNASTAECVNVKVNVDPPPIFGMATDSDGKYETKTVNMSQLVLVTMGALKSYTVHAYDINCLDQVHISSK
jgi:hypothetical protein